MPMRLGLDLGPNSIGWALVDTNDTKVVAAGVRVFPEGVDRDTKGGELSKSETRRDARGMRRQTARRAKRKWQLRRLLAETGLLPPEAALSRENPARAAWEDTTLQALDPYVLRRASLNGKLPPHDIGRVLLHLCQRRGFLSNRKSDKVRKKETSEMLQEISQLETEIVSAGSRTLGEHLAQIAASTPLARLRGRHTHRDMYKREFDAVWEAQRIHYPDLLTDGLKAKVHRIIFYQRPIRIPKSLIGCCELEPNRRRCPRADRRAQRFRMLQEVNNLLLIDEHGEDRPLRPEERQRLLDYLSASAKRKFEDIREHLGFSDVVQFNLQRAGRKTLYGMTTDKALSHKDCFGKAWAEMEDEQRNHIVRCLLDDDDEAIEHRATTEWGRSPQQAQAILAADLEEGYMSFCREAIAKLLPHLERGLPLMTGDNRPCAITEAGYLRPDQRPVERKDRLPSPPDLPNPIVRQALHEVRKVTNAIIREHGRPDQIHIELAREARGSAKQRWDGINRMRDNEARRDQAAEEIRKAGTKPTRDAINRYLLWKEQDTLCVYTGASISLNQLLGGEVDLDHILPKPRSLDDSMMNKVLCFREANAEKGNRTPYEWLAATDPQRYEQVCRRARKLPYGKYRKFLQKEVKLDDFIHRQLNDTAYISRAVRQYLQCLVADPHADVLCTKGQLTAELRHGWGLDTIIRELPDSPGWRDEKLDLPPGQKDRSDHRHHAIDAVVIALTDRSRLQLLAREKTCPPPRDQFRQEIADLVKTIHVSHRVRRGITGALHEETIYGKTGTPGEFVCRKPLEALTLAEIPRIRDDAVREKVTARLRQFSIEPGRKKKGSDAAAEKKPPAEVWKDTLWMNEEKKIPIKTVRLWKEENSVLPIRNGAAWVKPGNTHHVCIFELSGGKRDAVFVTMIEAARRAAKGEPLVRHLHPNSTDAKFIMSLSSGELVLANCEDGQRILQYNTGASTTKQLWFTDPQDARPSGDKIKFSFSPNTLKARKVIIDTLGRVRWAND